MAIPTSGYDTATITNPSSSLTDFTLIVDLSRMSTNWWLGVNTSDGTRGRASKDDGVTELACDWIDFNDTAETGLLRVKWSGTLASSGTQVIRIYPPNTANTAYGVSDTYGQYNAYDSVTEGYWPLSEDFNDRTLNQSNGTGNGGVVAGGVSGQIGNATDFDGIDDLITCSGVLDGDTSATILSQIYPSSPLQTDKVCVGKYTSFSDVWYLYRSDLGSVSSRVETAGVISSGNIGANVVAGSWQQLAAVFVGGTSYAGYRDVVNEFVNTTDTPPTAIATTSNFNIGALSAGNRYWVGRIQHVSAHSIDRTSSWISEESAQTSDNATFWGTWTWNSAGGGFTLTADAGTFTTTGQDSSLLFDRKVSAETGTFSTTGQDAGLFTARVLTADGGSYSTVGQDANLTLGTNIILSAEAGTFSVTGQDASLIHNKIINGETGEFTLSGQPASLIWSGEDFYVQLLTIGSDIQSTLSLSSSIQSTIQLEGKI